MEIDNNKVIQRLLQQYAQETAQQSLLIAQLQTALEGYQEKEKGKGKEGE